MRIPIWPSQIPDLAKFLSGLRQKHKYFFFILGLMWLCAMLILGLEPVPKSETQGFNIWLTSSLGIEGNFPVAT